MSGCDGEKLSERTKAVFAVFSLFSTPQSRELFKNELSNGITYVYSTRQNNDDTDGIMASVRIYNDRAYIMSFERHGNSQITLTHNNNQVFLHYILNGKEVSEEEFKKSKESELFDLYCLDIKIKALQTEGLTIYSPNLDQRAIDEK